MMSSTDQPLEILLICFDGYRRAAEVHDSLGEKIKTNGGDVPSTTLLQVDANGKAKVYSPAAPWLER